MCLFNMFNATGDTTHGFTRIRIEATSLVEIISLPAEAGKNVDILSLSRSGFVFLNLSELTQHVNVLHCI